MVKTCPFEEKTMALVSFVSLMAGEKNLNLIVDMGSSQAKAGQMETFSINVSCPNFPMDNYLVCEDFDPFIEVKSRNRCRIPSSPLGSGMVPGLVAVKTKNC